MEREEEKKESARFSPDVTAGELALAREFLESYRIGQRMLDCAEYDRKYFDHERRRRMYDYICEENGTERGGVLGSSFDETVLRVRMYGVQNLIETLHCDTNTRLLLYWHYLRGRPVTYCASIIGVSRASAFRIRRRALEAVARALRGRQQ